MTSEVDEYRQIHQIHQADELRDLVGEPTPRVRDKVRSRLDDVDRAWLAATPFCVMSTADADGNLDVSPKGDPPGFVHVIDDGTIAIPDRPGNRRVDGYLNVLVNPHVGLLFVLPGRGDTLRINGRARVISDAPFFDEMVVKNHRPQLALLVAVDEVFYHCSKAFLRSQLWQPETWDPARAPSRPAIAKALERPDDSMATLETYYGPSYAEHLYG